MEASVAKLRGGHHSEPDIPLNPDDLEEIMVDARGRIRTLDAKLISHKGYIPTSEDIAAGVRPRLIRPKEFELLNDIEALIKVFPVTRRIRIHDEKNNDPNAQIEVMVTKIDKDENGIWIHVISEDRKRILVSPLAVISHNSALESSLESDPIDSVRPGRIQKNIDLAA